MTHSKSTLYFFYGTLQDAGVLEIVLKDLAAPIRVGQACLQGHELKRAAGEDFPILVPSDTPGVSAHGTIFSGICSEGRERLIYFEGEEYNLVKVTIDNKEVWCFIPSELGYGVDGDWNFSTWVKNKHTYETYLKQVGDYMAYFGRDETFTWKS